MTQVAFPFLTIEDNAIVATEWIVSDSDKTIDIGKGWIEDWDYDRDLILEREFSVDLELAASQLKLPADELELELVLRIATGAGSMPRVVRIARSYTIDQYSTDVVFRELIKSNTLSSRLRVECLLLLRSEHDSSSGLSPSLSRSRLWSDRLDLRLEGEEPRFPMEFLDFSERFAGRIESTAPWYLHWIPGNHERDFGGAVRLFVNNQREDVTDRLLQGDRATVQVIFCDVMQQIVGNYLDQYATDLIAPEAPEGSIAAQVQFWLALAFPGQHVAQIRAMREQRPGSYHAALLAAADVASDQQQ